MNECSAFTKTQNSAQCWLQNPLPAALAHENTKGPIQDLVNNHPIYSNPAPVTHPSPRSDGGAPIAALPQVNEKVVDEASINAASPSVAVVSISSTESAAATVAAT